MSGLVGHSTYSKSGLIGALPAFEAKSTNNQSNMNNNTSHTFDHTIEWIQGPLTWASNIITTHLTGRYYFFWNIRKKIQVNKFFLKKKKYNNHSIL